MTVSEVLARYVAGASYEALATAAVLAAKRSLIDTLAVALGARGAPGTAEAMRTVERERAVAESSVWQTGYRTSARLAAFVNSLHASALDYDSLHVGTAVHPDIVVIPAVLAVGESERASGKDVIAAIVLGDDLLCRLGLSTRANRGWFYSSLHGVVASAAVVARLLKTNEASVADAMGLAFANGSGTQQPIVERNLSKRALAAFSAATGVFCGYLASEGFKGPREILEGKFGLYRMYEQGDPAVVIDELGRRFENVNISLKPYPSCQGNHAAIDGLLKLRKAHHLTPDNVAQIEVTVSPYTSRLVGAPFEPGAYPQVAAQFSLQYSLACVLLRGRLGIGDIQDEAVLDPKIRDLASRAVIKVDARNRGNYVPVDLVVTKTDGTSLATTVSALRGSVKAPLSDVELREKLATCLESGGYQPTLGKVDRLIESLSNIEQERDVSDLMKRISALLREKSTQKRARRNSKVAVNS